MTKALCPRARGMGAWRQWWSGSTECVLQKSESQEKKQKLVLAEGEGVKPSSWCFIIMLPALVLIRSDTLVLGPE